MPKFDTKKIREEAEKDHERAWLDSARLLEREGKFFILANKRKRHPLFDLIFKVRQILLELGFSETVVPMIIGKSEVLKQFGPEAPIILDRIFFLAELERPDIGISRKKLQEIHKIAPDLKEVGKLQTIFRQYKRGAITADDLVEVIVKELGMPEERAVKLLSLFEEFKELKPIPTSLTLRSHTTGSWFPVLRELQHREPLPLQLFSIGPKFRREQRLDKSHLYESWTASIVVMAEHISLDDGKRLTLEIMTKLGHRDAELKIKEVTSKYYAPRTEFEVFLKHPKTGEYLEVGDAGFYSPVALSNYDIAYPVFNLGIGLERLLMIETGEEDVRGLVYPYFYKPITFSDAELASMLRLESEPESEIGKKIAIAIVDTAERYANEPSPCEFVAFEGDLFGKHARVTIVEPESGTNLIGPAGFNEIYIYEGNIVGLPPKGGERDKFLNEVRTKGVSTGIRYMDAFAAKAAREIEHAAKSGKHQVKIRVRGIKLLGDINLKLEEVAQRYITTNRKRIDVRGPMFTTIMAEFG